MSLHQVTIRYDDDDLDEAIRSEAVAYETTKDNAALILIRRAAGLEVTENSAAIGPRLQKYSGTMTEEDRRRIEESVAEQDALDLARWNS